MTLFARKTRCPHCGHDPRRLAEFLEAKQAALPAVAAPEWILVSDKLPPSETWLIYYFKHVGVHIGKMEAGATCQADAVFYSRSGFLSGDVTHWMPLPIPPNEAFK